MTQSPRLALPYIQPGQAQKELTHNEALAAVDLVLAASLDGLFVNQPPTSPVIGACYIIGGNPTGAWAGHAHALVGFATGGWRFVTPVEGMTALDKASGRFVIYYQGAWEVGQLRGDVLILNGEQVVGPRLAAVADPTGGTVIDSEARAAIAAMLSRLRDHGLIEE